jgi:putative transposase
MQDVGRRHAQHVNRVYKRTGALYEGRFKSSLVETSTYFLACMRYIELNPVRAGMVGHPSAYPWSSFKQNVSGEPSGLIKAHAEYLQLGRDPPARGEAYRRLFDEAIGEDQLAAIRESAQESRALGSERFCDALEGTLRRVVRVRPQGRPAKTRPVPFSRRNGI